MTTTPTHPGRAHRARTLPDRHDRRGVHDPVRDPRPARRDRMGIAGHDHEMTDLSPAGLDARADARPDARCRRSTAPPRPTTIDQITLAAMRERLGLRARAARRGRVPAVPQQHRVARSRTCATSSTSCRPTPSRRGRTSRPGSTRCRSRSTATSSRCGSPRAPARSPRSARSRRPPARPPSWPTRRRRSSPRSSRATPWTRSSTSRPRARWCAPSSSTARPRPAARTRRSRRSCATSSRRRRPQADAAGRERYALWSRAFLGATVDLEETYQWGLEELARVVAEQEAVAAQIAGPGATVAQAVACSTRTPSRTLHGTDALQAWMQETSDAAIEALDGTHFDIPVPCCTPRVPDRPDAERRHLLHGPERRLQPPGPHVVVGAAGGHHVQHLAREDDRLPRGRPGPSPADRPGGAPSARR